MKKAGTELDKLHHWHEVDIVTWIGYPRSHGLGVILGGFGFFGCSRGLCGSSGICLVVGVVFACGAGVFRVVGTACACIQYTMSAPSRLV